MSNNSKIRKRNAISFETKLKILDCLELGEGPTSVGKKFGFNEATIRTIKKNENAIRRSATCSSISGCRTTSYNRDVMLVKMEKNLLLELKDLVKKGQNIDGTIIKRKALEIYNQLQKSSQSTSKQHFNASDGWLSGFLKRNKVHGLRDKKKFLSTFQNATSTLVDMNSWNVMKDHEYHIQNNPMFDMFENNIVEYIIDNDTKNENNNNSNNNNNKNNSINKSNNEDRFEVKRLTTSSIGDGLALGRFMVNHFLKIDPNTERALNFKENIERCMSVYQKLFDELKYKPQIHRLSISDFYKS